MTGYRFVKIPALRSLFAVACAMLIMTGSVAAQPIVGDVALHGMLPQKDAWRAYKARFVTAQGRVVDTANGLVSHSEGQGYGMLLAVAADDRPHAVAAADGVGHRGELDDLRVAKVGRAVAQVHRAGARHSVGTDGVVDRQTLEHHPSTVVGHGWMCTVHLGRGGRGGGTTITLGSARHHCGLGECAHAGRYCDDPR